MDCVSTDCEPKQPFLPQVALVTAASVGMQNGESHLLKEELAALFVSPQELPEGGFEYKASSRTNKSGAAWVKAKVDLLLTSISSGLHTCSQGYTAEM